MITQPTTKGRGSLPCDCPWPPLWRRSRQTALGYSRPVRLAAGRVVNGRKFARRCETCPRTKRRRRGGRASMAAARRQGTGLDSCLHTAKLCTPGSRGAAKCVHGAVAVQRRGFVAVRAASLSETPRRRPATARFFRRPTHVRASVNKRSGQDEHDVRAGKPGRGLIRTYRLSDELVRLLFWAIQEQERSPWHSQKAIL